jgi:hypothetical protein
MNLACGKRGAAAYLPEAQLGPKIIQGLDEFAFVAFAVKNMRSAIDVGSEMVDRVLTVEMLRPRRRPSWASDSPYRWLHQVGRREPPRHCLVTVYTAPLVGADRHGRG